MSYAGDAPDAARGPALVATVDGIRAGLLARATPVRRVLARVLPRSLVVRPGAAQVERERESVG